MKESSNKGSILLEAAVAIMFFILAVSGGVILLVRASVYSAESTIEIQGNLFAREGLEVLRALAQSDFNNAPFGTYNLFVENGQWVLGEGESEGRLTRVIEIYDISNPFFFLPLNGNALNVTGNSVQVSATSSSFEEDRRDRESSALDLSLDNYLEVTDLSLEDDFTVMVWAKEKEDSGKRVLFSLENSESKITSFTQEEGVWKVEDGSSSFEFNYFFKVGAWNLHTITFSDGKMKYFLNEKKVLEEDVSFPQLEAVRIGEDDGDFWNGAVDEVRAYTREVTQAEVGRVYRSLKKEARVRVSWDNLQGNEKDVILESYLIHTGYLNLIEKESKKEDFLTGEAENLFFSFADYFTLKKRDYDENHIAVFKFDEDYNEVVLDEKNNFFGTAEAGAEVVEDGFFKKAMSFAGGSDSKILFEDKVIPLGEKTIRFRIKTESDTGVIFSNADSFEDQGDLIKLKDGKINWVSNMGGTEEIIGEGEEQEVITVEDYRFDVSSNTLVNDGEWHDVMLTWDGTINADAVKIYINDDNQPDVTSTATEEESTLQSFDLTIGALLNGESSFVGFLDEIEISDVERSSFLDFGLYFQEGERISPVFDFSDIEVIRDARVFFKDETPEDTSVIVEVRVAFEIEEEEEIWSSWEEIESGEVIPFLFAGKKEDLIRVQVKQRLTTNDKGKTPVFKEMIVHVRDYN